MSLYPLVHPDLVSLCPPPGIDLHSIPISEMRALIAAAVVQAPVDTLKAKQEEVVIKGGDGEDLRLLCLRPAQVADTAGRELLPTILALHGGGGVLMTPESETLLFTKFCVEGFQVISPDYRLAPEHLFPAANDDCQKAWEWLLTEEAKAFGIDSARLAVLGVSAGGALAASVAIRASQNLEAIQPKLVVLDSPVLDDRVIYPAQQAGHPLEKYYWWTAENARDAQRLVFGGEQATLPVYGAPLRSTSSNDFKGLAPHYIAVAELDSLVDHGFEYTSRLRAAGVSVELHLWRGGLHAFVHPGVQTQFANVATNLMIGSLKVATAPTA